MVMDFLKKTFKRVKFFKYFETYKNRQLKPEERLEKCLKSYQRYFFKAQDIVLWKEPSESLLAFFLANVAFWLISRIEWRFYGLLFTLAFGVLLHDMLTDHIWPKDCAKQEKDTVSFEDAPPEGRMTVPELAGYAGQLRVLIVDQITRFGNLRSSQPAIFCAMTSCAWLVLAGLGRMLSGFSLTYITVMMSLILPGAFIHLLPQEMKDKVSSFLSSIHSVIAPSERSVDVDEYVPESSKENMALLAQAGEVVPDSNASTSSMSEGCVMPSHEESSLDALDSLSLDPVPSRHSESEDSDDAHLPFKSSHFNGGDSSSDEESRLLGKGLKFPDLPTAPINFSDVIAKNLNKLGGNLPIFGFGKLRPPPSYVTQDDSSDSDFEIIDSDEFS